MKRFKFTAIIIIFSMVLTLVGAGTTLKEAVSVDGTVSFVTGDLHIIRPAESDNGVELSSKLYKALKNSSSAAITLADDTSKEHTKEIIIGESDRAETAYAYSLLAQQGGGLDNDYIICELTGDSKQFVQMFKSYITGDGNVDLVDVAKLERYLASWNRYDFLNLNLTAGDMNDDGFITTEDLLILKKMLAGHGGFWGDGSTDPDVGGDDGENGEWTLGHNCRKFKNLCI